MKKILITAFAACLALSAAEAQQTNNKKNDDTNGQQILGEENETDAQPQDESSNYRNNRVSRNPNNVSVDEGGTRKGTNNRNETSESSEGVPNGSDQATNDNDAATSSAPVVNDMTSSPAGSPAIATDKPKSERDGTNTIQSAKPNMAGSPSNGINTGKKSIDADQEIRRTTMQQQKAADQQANSNDSTNNNNTRSQQRKNSSNRNDQTVKNATKAPVGPKSGQQSVENKNLKQPINSGAENTNGREIEKPINQKEVKAMDTGASDKKGEEAKEDHGNRKKGRHKRHKH